MPVNNPLSLSLSFFPWSPPLLPLGKNGSIGMLSLPSVCLKLMSETTLLLNKKKNFERTTVFLFCSFRHRSDEDGRVYLGSVDHSPSDPTAEDGRPVKRVLQLFLRRPSQLNPSKEDALKQYEHKGPQPEAHGWRCF